MFKKLLVVLFAVSVFYNIYTDLRIIQGGEKNMKWNSLTLQEQQIIENKSTERPFSGEYDKFFETGTYTCKRCDSKLYTSESKFNSGCGWPAFDDEIKGAVKRIPDADGRRVEIVCASCNGHLGHVFEGEQLTSKNVRHCVNSLSMKFIPAKQNQLKRGVFASGCFWGTEYMFQKQKGVEKTRVGYTGGQKENPTYEEVCTGSTGHVEALEVFYDPNLVSYEALVKLFFETHDFSQENGQGPDIGSQYLSMVFVENEQEKETVERVMNVLKGLGRKVATRVEKAAPFYPGEDYHQKYYTKTGKTPYCHAYKKIFQ